MLDDSSYSLVTENVRVTVEPAPAPESSDTFNRVFAFSYTITIENLSPRTVQLLERHWIVNSADVQVAEVIGPGVVGKQPVLKPGELFTYTSGTVINDPVGTMEGVYTFRNEDRQLFEVRIPRFGLIYPVMVH